MHFVEELNHIAVTYHQTNYLDVITHELLLKHGQFNTDPATIIQPSPSGERVVEYYDIDSEFDDEECDNIREYDSDSDNFYYD